MNVIQLPEEFVKEFYEFCESLKYVSVACILDNEVFVVGFTRRDSNLAKLFINDFNTAFKKKYGDNILGIWHLDEKVNEKASIYSDFSKKKCDLYLVGDIAFYDKLPVLNLPINKIKDIVFECYRYTCKSMGICDIPTLRESIFFSDTVCLPKHSDCNLLKVSIYCDDSRLAQRFKKLWKEKVGFVPKMLGIDSEILVNMFNNCLSREDIYCVLNGYIKYKKG